MAAWPKEELSKIAGTDDPTSRVKVYVTVARDDRVGGCRGRIDHNGDKDRAA